MTVTVEKFGPVTTVIHHRPEARNAMDPASADALVDAFLVFDADPEASVVQRPPIRVNMNSGSASPAPTPLL